jgi:small multidrug resistance pump
VNLGVAAVLGLGILAELIATSSLKMADGLTRPWWLAGVVIGYLAAFYCFSVTLRTVPLGSAYAIWAGMGIVGSAVIGMLAFRQSIAPGALAGILLICVGVALTGAYSRT